MLRPLDICGICILYLEVNITHDNFLHADAFPVVASINTSAFAGYVFGKSLGYNDLPRSNNTTEEHQEISW